MKKGIHKPLKDVLFIHFYPVTLQISLFYKRTKAML